MVTTDLVKQVHKILEQCFPKSHKLNKILNKNTVRVCYSTTANMAGKIKQHNKKVIRDSKEEVNKRCTCHKADECPLENDCNHSSVIYQGIVHDLGGTNDLNREEKDALEEMKAKEEFKPKKIEKYVGSTGGKFKIRWYKHMSDFRIRENAKTELGKYVWKMKDYQRRYKIEWMILAKAAEYNTDTKICNLCNKEKFFILFRPEKSTLNKRDEILSKCPHRRGKIIENN